MLSLRIRSALDFCDNLRTSALCGLALDVLGRVWSVGLREEDGRELSAKGAHDNGLLLRSRRKSASATHLAVFGLPTTLALMGLFFLAMRASFSTTSLRLLAPVLCTLVLALKGLLVLLSPCWLPLHLGLGAPEAVLGLQDGSLASEGLRKDLTVDSPS